MNVNRRSNLPLKSSGIVKLVCPGEAMCLTSNNSKSPTISRQTYILYGRLWWFMFVIFTIPTQEIRLWVDQNDWSANVHGSLTCIRNNSPLTGHLYHSVTDTKLLWNEIAFLITRDQSDNSIAVITLLEKKNHTGIGLMIFWHTEQVIYLQFPATIKSKWEKKENWVINSIKDVIYQLKHLVKRFGHQQYLSLFPQQEISVHTTASVQWPSKLDSSTWISLNACAWKLHVFLCLSLQSIL